MSSLDEVAEFAVVDQFDGDLRQDETSRMRGYLKAWRENIAILASLLVVVALVAVVVVLSLTGHHPQGPVHGR